MMNRLCGEQRGTGKKCTLSHGCQITQEDRGIGSQNRKRATPSFASVLQVCLERTLIAGRLVRELERNFGDNHGYDELLAIFKKILFQRCNSCHRIYSIYEPEVQCISKGT